MIEIEGCQAETMRVIGKAEEYVRENKITKGQIWCVYDKDSFPASDVNGVVQRARVLNQKNPDVQYYAGTDGSIGNKDIQVIYSRTLSSD